MHHYVKSVNRFHTLIEEMQLATAMLCILASCQLAHNLVCCGDGSIQLIAQLKVAVCILLFNVVIELESRWE